MIETNLNKVCAEVHEEQVARGFYDEKREMGTLLMLIVSELSEALEADRKGRHIDISQFPPTDDPEVFKATIKDSFEDEIADTFIRLFDLVGYLGIDIDAHIAAKMNFNRSRGYKHGKKY